MKGYQYTNKSFREDILFCKRKKRYNCQYINKVGKKKSNPSNLINKGITHLLFCKNIFFIGFVGT